MSRPPKRALLSLRSMLVMYFVMAAFAWANTAQRLSDRSDPRFTVNPPPTFYAWRMSDSGFPWSHRTEPRRLLILDGAGGLITSVGLQRATGDVSAQVDSHVLLMNLAVALVVSALIAMASERFVFSRVRRTR